ncbi:glutamate receptor 1-like [Penaeus japonicus]|uniref:glutamate receptor 1-like n=1 Tax=Penaeus japonicus TaxID=27405 RepID=UPI001C71104A|nr:glutamate receptor 1-like [Penaeus japonicus]
MRGVKPVGDGLVTTTRSQLFCFVWLEMMERLRDGIASTVFQLFLFFAAAIFDKGSNHIQGAFFQAMEQYNQNASERSFKLHAYMDRISTADVFKISRLVCRQFSRTVFAIVGAVQPDSFDTLHSYANTFQIPFVTPWFPENVPNPSSGLMDYATSMRPDYHRAIIDLIIHYRWDHIIYLYDSHDGEYQLRYIVQRTRVSVHKDPSAADPIAFTCREITLGIEVLFICI